MGAGTGVKMGSVHPQANGDDVPLFFCCVRNTSNLALHLCNCLGLCIDGWRGTVLRYTKRLIWADCLTLGWPGPLRRSPTAHLNVSEDADIAVPRQAPDLGA